MTSNSRISTSKCDPEAAIIPNDGSAMPRPLHNLMLILPQLCVQGPAIDFDASDPEVLVALARHATDTMNTAHRGMRTIGYLIAQSAPEISDGMPSDAVEALGWILAKLADCAALCDYLATTARRHTADYDPPPKARSP